MAVQGHSATTRTAAAGRRSAPRFTAMLLVVALLASACGSTAYRDRVDLLAQAGEQAQDPVTGEATTESPDVPAPDATDAATEGTDPGEGDPVVGQPGAPSATEGQTGNGTTGGGTGGNTGGTTDGQQPPPTTQPPSSNLPQTSDNGRGVTNDTVRIGVIALSSFQNLGSNLGFTVADKGDIRAQIRDLAAWINSNGGIAGRNIEPIIRIYTQEEASPGAEAQICNAFADDDQVFAVMLYGQIHESTRECYASKRVLMIDPTPFVFDEVLYQQLSPYLWSTSYPNYSRVARTLPHALAGTDFFQPMASRSESDVKVGVLHWDTPSARRVLQRDLAPALEAVGQQVDSSYGVNGSSIATIQNGLSNAITRFRQAGVNRVMFIGGSPLAPFFFSTAESNSYRPRYGITSLDNPRHSASERGNPAQMRDAIGIGFNLDTDVPDEQVPLGATERERLCLEVLASKGHNHERRENANYSLAVCESFLLLQDAGRTITDGLTVPVWAAHAEALGTSFKPVMWYDAEFGPGNHDGTATYRLIKHDTGCECFRYQSSSTRLR
jgi:ABC-type branched-subunit amino acid transport system substrate-binding protein